MTVCMHTPDVTCPNCQFDYPWHRPVDDYRGIRRLPEVPDVDTDTDNHPKIRFDWCKLHGHDFVACDGYVICNVCERVVHVAAGDSGQ